MRQLAIEHDPEGIGIALVVANSGIHSASAEPNVWLELPALPLDRTLRYFAIATNRFVQADPFATVLVPRRAKDQTDTNHFRVSAEFAKLLPTDAASGNQVLRDFLASLGFHPLENQESWAVQWLPQLNSLILTGSRDQLWRMEELLEIVEGRLNVGRPKQLEGEQQVAIRNVIMPAISLKDVPIDQAVKQLKALIAEAEGGEKVRLLAIGVVD